MVSRRNCYWQCGSLCDDRLVKPWLANVGGYIVYSFDRLRILFFGQKMPKTERVQMGISTVDMWKAVVKPLFLLMGFCMLLTASTELATTQRISSLLVETGVSAILVLAFINGIMALGRAFAGPVVHRLSNSGVLLFSAVFSCLGLLWLSYAQGATTFAAAAVFAIGVCYFWPTMLGFVAEYVPESGALGLSIMGGLGMLSVSAVLPLMGFVLDRDVTGGETLRLMVYLPGILIFIFLGLYLWSKKNKDNEVKTPTKETETVA